MSSIVIKNKGGKVELPGGYMDGFINHTIIYSVLIAFVVGSIIAPIFIPVLKRLKFGQYIRGEGPEKHKSKSGTPTMGGIIFLLTTFLCFFVMIRKVSDVSFVALIAFVAYGLIGFADDFLKIRKKNNLGLRAYQKLILLFIVSLGIAIYAYNDKNIGSSIIIPYLKINIDLGIWYIPLIVFFLLAITNAVNLTDGLDGLCTTITLLVLTFFAMISFSFGQYTLSILCVIVVGALLAFLRFNAFPARVFMGDTGSLALGGFVGIVAIFLKLPLIIIIVGGIYLIETLSVIIQVTYFKFTKGKRFFKMAPIHHHFEMLGWPEPKIVSVFSIVTVILCLIAFLSF